MSFFDEFLATNATTDFFDADYSFESRRRLDEEPPPPPRRDGPPGDTILFGDPPPQPYDHLPLSNDFDFNDDGPAASFGYDDEEDHHPPEEELFDEKTSPHSVKSPPSIIIFDASYVLLTFLLVIPMILWKRRTITKQKAANNGNGTASTSAPPDNDSFPDTTQQQVEQAASAAEQEMVPLGKKEEAELLNGEINGVVERGHRPTSQGHLTIPSGVSLSAEALLAVWPPPLQQQQQQPQQQEPQQASTTTSSAAAAALHPPPISSIIRSAAARSDIMGAAAAASDDVVSDITASSTLSASIVQQRQANVISSARRASLQAQSSAAARRFSSNNDSNLQEEAQFQPATGRAASSALPPPKRPTTDALSGIGSVASTSRLYNNKRRRPSASSSLRRSSHLMMMKRQLEHMGVFLKNNDAAPPPPLTGDNNNLSVLSDRPSEGFSAAAPSAETPPPTARKQQQASLPPHFLQQPTTTTVAAALSPREIAAMARNTRNASVAANTVLQTHTVQGEADFYRKQALLQHMASTTTFQTAATPTSTSSANAAVVHQNSPMAAAAKGMSPQQPQQPFQQQQQQYFMQQSSPQQQQHLSSSFAGGGGTMMMMSSPPFGGATTTQRPGLVVAVARRSASITHSERSHLPALPSTELTPDDAADAHDPGRVPIMMFEQQQQQQMMMMGNNNCGGTTTGQAGAGTGRRRRRRPGQVVSNAVLGLPLEFANPDIETRFILKMALQSMAGSVADPFLRLVLIGIVSHHIGSDSMVAFVLVNVCLRFTMDEMSGAITDTETILIQNAMDQAATSEADDADEAAARQAASCHLVGQYMQLALCMQLLFGVPLIVAWAFGMETWITWLLHSIKPEIATLASGYTNVIVIEFLVRACSRVVLLPFQQAAHDVNGAPIPSFEIYLDLLGTAMTMIAIAVVVASEQSLFGDKPTLVAIALIQVVVTIGKVIAKICYIVVKGWFGPYQAGFFSCGVANSQSSAMSFIRTSFTLLLGSLIELREWDLLILFTRFLGPAEVSTWAICGNVWEVFEASTAGLGDAGSSRIAYYLGENLAAPARRIAQKVIFLASIQALGFSSLILLLGPNISVGLITDYALQRIFENLMGMTACANMSMTFAQTYWSLVGAQGRYGLASASILFCRWIVIVPFAAVCVFGFNFGLESVAGTIAVGYATAALILVRALIFSDWQQVAADQSSFVTEQQQQQASFQQQQESSHTGYVPNASGTTGVGGDSLLRHNRNNTPQQEEPPPLYNDEDLDDILEAIDFDAPDTSDEESEEDDDRTYETKSVIRVI